MSPSWRTALITGASSGIGEALALQLADDGVEVVVCARRRERLDDLVVRIQERGGRARAITMDVTDGDATVELIRRVDLDLDGLDLVIANAGIGRPLPARTLDWEQGRATFATNFMGAMATLTAVLPRMVGRRRGHLVGVSSLVVYAPAPEGSAYRATKAGLTAFLENLRAELGATGVKITAVHPGFVRTPLADAFPDRSALHTQLGGGGAAYHPQASLRTIENRLSLARGADDETHGAVAGVLPRSARAPYRIRHARGDGRRAKVTRDREVVDRRN